MKKWFLYIRFTTAQPKDPFTHLKVDSRGLNVLKRLHGAPQQSCTQKQMDIPLTIYYQY